MKHPLYPDMPPLPDRVVVCRPEKWFYLCARAGDSMTHYQFHLSSVWRVPEWDEVEIDWSWVEWRALTDEEREGPDPEPGDLLWFWGWTDQTDDGPVDRVYVRVERRVLTEAEQQQLQASLRVLSDLA